VKCSFESNSHALECVSGNLVNSSDFEMVEEKMGGCWSQTKVIEALMLYHFGILFSVISV